MSVLADFLQAQRDAIIQRFTARGQTALVPGPLTASDFINHLPGLLDELAQALREGGPPSERVFSRSGTAEEHGRQRLRLGFDLLTLVREYGLLRDCIFEGLEAAGLTPPLHELRFLSVSLSAATADSASQYAKAHQEALDAERRHLLGLFQQAPGFLCFLRGPQLVFDLANAAYFQLVGHRDILGRPLREALPELEGQGYPELLERVYRTGEPFVGHGMKVSLQREPGAERSEAWVDFVYQPIRGPDGRVTGILAQGQDVTEVKRQQALREEAEAALRASEERYRMLFASIDDGFCLMQLLFDEAGEPVDYRFLETNAAFEGQTGLKGAVGRTARALVPDLDASWFRLYGGVALSGKPVRFENHAPAMGRWFEVFASRVGAPELRQVALVFKDITERKRIEAERAGLLAREQAARADAVAERQKLHDLFEQAPVAICIHEGPGHRYTFANSAYRAIVGGRDVVGKTLLEALPELEGQGFDALLDQVVETGLPAYGDERPATLNREGRTETGWFNFIFSPKRNAAGQVDGVMQCAFEVTQQVRSRQQVEALAEQLRQGEEHLRRVVDVTQVGTWEVELATRQVAADARLRELFGVAPDAPFSLDEGLARIHAEDRPRVARAIADALAGGNGGHYRVEYRTGPFPDGRVRWVEARGQVSFGPEGQPVRFLGTGLDITARKSAELAQQALLEGLGAQPFLGVALYRGPRRIIELANPLFRQVVGSGRDILGRPLDEALPELAEQGFAELLDRVLRTGEPFIGRGLPATFEQRPGERRQEFFFDFVYHPVRGWDGHDAVLVLFQDVTHAVRARQFEQQLIGIVSHDLRSPLQAILLGTASLLRREELDERTTKAVARVRVAAERASRMVTDLLDFTQARLGGGIPLVARPTDLHAVIRETVEEVQANHPERELRVESQGEGRGTWDADRLAQVVQNLVSNAVKYSPPGTLVTVRSSGDADSVELQVHNAGTPIAPEALKRLFQPLQRATDVADSTGRSVGLGLYIVAEVVRAHRGRVAVTSTDAGGTTFTVSLPRGTSTAG
ncbi:PAS domain-containing protein [Pyxidicoccus sp. 3LFB2]